MEIFYSVYKDEKISTIILFAVVFISFSISEQLHLNLHCKINGILGTTIASFMSGLNSFMEDLTFTHVYFKKHK